MKSLFKLVKSLHPTEKRYVNLKLQSSKSNSLLHNYFETIQSQTEYDFDAISEKHNKTSPKVLKNSLRNLYANVLKYLRSYNAQSDDEATLANMLKDVKNLREKSMLEEAGKLNKKLLKLSNVLELFYYEKEALSNSWDLEHLKGRLSLDFTEEMEQAFEEIEGRELELTIINKSYRKAVTLYYQYYFYEKTEQVKQQLVDIANSPIILGIDSLNSSRSKMGSFEIQAMGALIQLDFLAHHNVRKEQYKLLLTSEVFRKDYLSQILVCSNLFTYLKTVSAIRVLEAYIDYMKRYFLPLVEKNTDGVLTEKYYDIYFQNQIYLQNWYLDKNVISRLLEEFKTVSKKEFRRNNLLVSRVYLSFAQLLILSGDFKFALKHLIEYQSLSLDKKNSTNFVDSELHLLMLYHLMGKQDVFDNSVETIRRKERIETIVFTPDQKALFQAFLAVYKGTEIEDFNYNGNKKWLKIYIDVLAKMPLEEAIKAQYDNSKFKDLPEEMAFLKSLKAF